MEKNSNFDELHKRTGQGSLKWDFQRTDNEILPLWLADMDFHSPQAIIEALTERARHGIFGYTEPTDEYFESIIHWIITTSGTVPSINLAIQSFTRPGDGIIIQPPVFHPFAQSVKDNNRTIITNPLKYEGGRYEMDLVDLETKAARQEVKMIIFCSPHNPVGRVWSPEELGGLAQICKKHDLLIISDEIHCDLVYPWANFTSMGALDPSLHERLIICNGPSKTFNLAALKTSNVIIPDPVLREQFLIALRNLNELFGYSAFGLLALQTAYEEGRHWLAELMIYLEANLNYLGRFLEQHITGMHLVRPEAMYLAWVDCSELELSPDELKQLFNKAGVRVDHGDTYGAGGERFIRINIACPMQMLECALERLRSAFDSLQPEGR
jgi:cystathionine beta-lyase